MHPESWYNSLNQSIAQEIQRRRTELDWTLYRLSVESGVSWSMVKSVETNKHRPSVETLARLANALGSNASKILAAAEKQLKKDD